MKIVRTNTQRNGISGLPFVQALIRLNDVDTTLILTIGYDNDGNLDATTCRVVNPFDLSDCFRGNTIGTMFINKYNA